MAQRKLGKVAEHRTAMLKMLTTQVILNEQIETTLPKAKELKKIVDSMISLAVKEGKNFEMTKIKVSAAKIDSTGKKVTEKTTSKNGNVYYKVVRETSQKEVQKDMPSRLAARRKMINQLDKLVDQTGTTIDLTQKLFTDIASRYEGRVGGYTRIIKIGNRKGDNAEMAILQLI